MPAEPKQIHYEIFIRQGSKGGWKLHDVAQTRDEALADAKAAMTNGATGVKVIKETFDPGSGDFITLKILEEGHNQPKFEAKGDDAPAMLPCFKPDDLYSYHARATMTRLLAEYLARHKLTITELIHRADALEKFEATGTVYQHAIQRVAVAQAASTKKPVQQIIKDLTDLSTKAMARIYRDDRKGVFPDVAAGGFAGLAAKLAGDSGGAFILNGAIAKHLAPAKVWDEKIEMLLAILSGCAGKEPNDPACELLRACVDGIAAEIVSGSAALADLIGPHDNLGDALTTLIHLFLGQPRTDKDSGDGVQLLTRHFAQDLLPSARTALATRIMTELKGMKKLTGDNPLDEIAMLRKVANKLVLGLGKYLSHDDLIAAFNLRSQRLVTYEKLARLIEPCSGPDDKLDRLLTVEESIIGVANKRQLASVMEPIVNAPQFATYFAEMKLAVPARLQRLHELQRRLLRSGLPDNKRCTMSEALDKVACGLEAKAKLIDTALQQGPTAGANAATLLKLLHTGIFTEGVLAAKARTAVASLIVKPGFLEDYARQVSKDAPLSLAAARDHLLQALEKAGIPVEGKSQAAA